MKHLKLIKFFIFISVLNLSSTLLFSQCHVPNFFPENFDDVEIHALYTTGQLVKIGNLASFETFELKLVRSQNVIFGESVEITHLVFATGCRDLSVSTLDNFCSRGTFCVSDFECPNDFFVWTLPSKIDAVCNNIDLTFAKDFSGLDPIYVEIKYITVIEFPCAEIVYPEDKSFNIDTSTTISWNQINEAIGYRISIGTTPNGTQIANKKFIGTANSYKVEGLEYNKTYYCTIYPIYALIELTDCPEISFTTSRKLDCSFCCSFPSSYTDCFGFEDFTTGELIPQGSPKFTLFNASSLSATITNLKSLSGIHSMKFGNLTNIDYNINRTISESTPTRLEWAMFLPNQRSGTWALETNNANVYPIRVKLNNGNAEVYNTTNNVTTLKTTIKYSQNTWIKFTLIFQPHENEIELWIDGKFIFKVIDYGSNKITDLNFAGDPLLNTNEFYVDNLCYNEFLPFINCSNEYEPVCADNIEFDNECYAFFSGYSACELTKGQCGTVGTEEEFDQNDIDLYPNPTSGLFLLSCNNNTKKTYTLYDIFGTQVYNGIFYDTIDFDLTNNCSGVYLLKVVKEDKIITKKIVLEN